jgi:hypothetical protein
MAKKPKKGDLVLLQFNGMPDSVIIIKRASKIREGRKCQGDGWYITGRIFPFHKAPSTYYYSVRYGDRILMNNATKSDAMAYIAAIRLGLDGGKTNDK